MFTAYVLLFGAIAVSLFGLLFVGRTIRYSFDPKLVFGWVGYVIHVVIGSVFAALAIFLFQSAITAFNR